MTTKPLGSIGDPATGAAVFQMDVNDQLKVVAFRCTNDGPANCPAILYKTDPVTSVEDPNVYYASQFPPGITTIPVPATGAMSIPLRFDAVHVDRLTGFSFRPGSDTPAVAAAADAPAK